MKTLKYLRWLVFVLGAGIVLGPMTNDPKTTPALRSALERASETKIWVYFTDKPEALSRSLSAEQLGVTEKAQRRRSKTMKDPLTARDVPVDRFYRDVLENTGFQTVQSSAWLNAVSGYASEETIRAIAALPFVRRVDVVRNFKTDRKLEEPSHADMALTKSSAVPFDSAFYGASYTQLRQIHVPELHRGGLAGQGVTIAVFDNGFRLLAHQVFDSMTIVDSYDFVDHKVNVAPNNPSTLFGSHGINTLSVIGGYREGQLIGPAYRANYLLARTENDSSETSVEEDNWIAALEWAENLGADVISSSLGYTDMTDPGSVRSYDWTWMSGDSTVITQGANIGVQMGLVIVNSAGNAFSNSQHNTLGAPADGDSVIAAGAVDSRGIRSDFSSVGPTTKGRIKPDVMAMGENVRVAIGSSTTQYSSANGTSFSCPLTAGVCALILNAHPELTPAQVRRSLTATASRANNPNNTYGYGLINALAAVNYYGEVVADTIPDQFVLQQNAPNPFNPTTTIRYDIYQSGRVKLEVFNVLGQKVKTLIDQLQPVQKNYSVVWDGRDDRGFTVPSGVYFYRLNANGFVRTKRMLFIK